MTTKKFKNGDVVIPSAGGKYPADALTVNGYEGGKMRAAPLGGGFVYAFDAAGLKKHNFRVVTAEEMAAATYRKTMFGIDGVGPGHEGFTNDRLWNGWQQPLFEKAAIKDLLGDWGWEWNEETETGSYGEGEELMTTTASFNKKLGIKVWSFDGMCFAEVKPPPADDDD